MMKAIQASMIAVAIALVSVPAWAGPQEDFKKGYGYYQAENYDEAVKWYRKAAEQGYAPAQYRLGELHYDGQGVPQDYAEAAKWQRKGADQGYVSSQTALGVTYAMGKGVSQDYAEAAKWYRKAAEQGDAYTQFNLGIAYEKGEGVPQVYVTAHMWYNLSAATSRHGSDERRDDIAEKMTPAQIIEAQRRARVCLDSGYKNCD